MTGAGYSFDTADRRGHLFSFFSLFLLHFLNIINWEHTVHLQKLQPRGKTAGDPTNEGVKLSVIRLVRASGGEISYFVVNKLAQWENHRQQSQNKLP